MLTQAIENLLNRNLPRSPRAQELCAALTGKRIRVDARGLGWVLIAESLNTSLRLTKHDSGSSPPDAEISGSLFSLAALAWLASRGGHPARRRQHPRRCGGGAEIPRAGHVAQA
jgi:ubiquinone biosynthesis protein UbiJ